MLKKNLRRKIIFPVLLLSQLFLWSPSARAQAEGDFYWWADKRDFVVSAGSTVTVSINEITRYDWNGPVTFSFIPPANAPDMTATITPNPVTGQTTTLVISIPESTPQDLYYGTIRGAAIGITRDSLVELDVKASTAMGPRLTVNPTAINWTRMVGLAGVSRSVTVQNPGIANLQISAISLSGSDASFFSVTNGTCVGRNIAAGSNCTFRVFSASPTEARKYSANINFASNAPSNPILPVSLQGTDFSISLNPTSLSIIPGATGSVTVNVNRKLNTSTRMGGAITVTTTGLPSGVTANVLTIASGANSGVLTLNVASTAQPTEAPVFVIVNGTTSGRTKSSTLSLAVGAQPTPSSFSLLATPAALNINQGESGSVSVGINRTNFTEAVTLALNGAPLGVTSSFSPNDTTGNTSALHLSVSSGVTAGSYNMTVEGTSGSRMQSIPLTLSVAQATTVGDFTMSASPASLSLRQGQIGNMTVSITRTNFANSVNVAVSGLPSGSTASCNPVSTTGNNSNCSVSVGTSTTTGSYNLTVEGTSGGSTRTATVILTVSAPSSGTLAFPGAFGFGAHATGGRGGDVCIVKNLNTSGSGSLQNCLDTATGPRTIVLRVSGVIPTDIQIIKRNITLAGQTSPNGIIVRGLHTTEEPFCDQGASCLNTAQKAENLIIRHIRSRGWEDAIRIRAAKNVIVDHSSFENATDEAGEFSFSNNITVMNTLFAESLGGHMYNGTLFNYSEPTVGLQLDRITMAYNNWNRLNERFPELSRESPNAAQTNMDIELINNLLWDQSFTINVADTTTSGGSGADNAPNRVYYRLNWIGNYSVPRSDYSMGMIDMFLRDDNTITQTRTYFHDNHMSLYSNKSNYDLKYCCNDFSASIPNAVLPVWASETPLTYGPGLYGNHVPITSTLDSRTQIRRYIFENAGAFPRDPMDQRLLNPVCTGQIDSTARNINPTNDAFQITNSTTAPTDTDDDGMPDAWETAHGLSPNAMDNNGHELSADGYTNLEVYLNELSDTLVANDPNNKSNGSCHY